MDYDVLVRIANSAKKAILSQDTTDYWETLSPNCQLIVNLNPAAGDIRTCVVNLASIWDDNIEHKKRQLETALASRTMLGEEREREQQKINEMVNRPKIELRDLDGLGVELAVGAESVGRATLSVFEWMLRYAPKTGGIKEPSSKQEVRRRKEGAGGGSNKSSTATAATSSYMSTARQKQMREDQLRQQAEAAKLARTLEGKVSFSCISLTYGLPHALIRDELYVNEDGKVALVIRTPLPPDEGYIAEVVQMRDAAVMDPTGGAKAKRSDAVAGRRSGSTSPRRTDLPQSGRGSNNNNNNSVAAIAASSGASLNATSAVATVPPQPPSPRGGRNHNNTTNNGALTTMDHRGVAISPRGAGGIGGSGRQQQQQQLQPLSAPVGCSRVLDFSFRKIETPFDLLRKEPAHYIRHLPAPIAKEAPKNLAEEVRAQRNAAQQEGLLGLAGAGPGKMVKITAKNSRGEVQRYGFSIGKLGQAGGGGDNGDDGSGGSGGNGGMLGGGDGSAGSGSGKKSATEIEFENLVANLRTKVVCDSVRICNNELSGADQLLPVLRNLVVNHYLRVQWLDLSNNNLAAVPAEISQLPLHALHLHGNKIESWESLERELPRLTRLQHFTIFGNPVAENAATFRPRALAILLHVPFKLLPFKCLDYVPLTLVDVQSAAGYLRMYPRSLELTKPGENHHNNHHHQSSSSPARGSSPVRGGPGASSKSMMSASAAASSNNNQNKSTYAAYR